MSESNTIVQGHDLITLLASSNSNSGAESSELQDVNDGPHLVDSQLNNAEAEAGEVNVEILEVNEGDVRNPQNNLIMEAKVDNTLAGNSSDMEISDQETETLRVVKILNDVSSGAHSISFTVKEKLDISSVSSQTRCLDVQNGSPIQIHTMDELVNRSLRNFYRSGQSGKLNMVHCKKMNPLNQEKRRTFLLCELVQKSPLLCNIVPLYDRGFAMGLTSADASSNLEGGPEIKGEASRCFNCGSYSHSLKQCPKPRDSVAVNNARKQHQKFKRNQNAASRNAIRYYQSSQGRKYDDLKPGILGAETRELLGLGEFDPPTWLKRMREIGYPPGYLAPEDEDEPSGITIYGDEETDDGHEDGKIATMVQPEPKMKMTVEFPGINAPIPAKADKKLWSPDPSSSESFRSRSQSHYRINHSSEPGSRWLEQRYYGDFQDEGPPGVDFRVSSSEPGSRWLEQRYYGEFQDEVPPGVDFRVSSSYPPRYGNYDSAYCFQSPRDPISRPRSPTLGMSYHERSPMIYEDFATYGSYSSSGHSPWSHGCERGFDDRWDNSYHDYSSWSGHPYQSRW